MRDGNEVATRNVRVGNEVCLRTHRVGTLHFMLSKSPFAKYFISRRSEILHIGEADTS